MYNLPIIWQHNSGALGGFYLHDTSTDIKRLRDVGLEMEILKHHRAPGLMDEWHRRLQKRYSRITGLLEHTPVWGIHALLWEIIKRLAVDQACGQTCVLMHYSTPCKSSITHCPTVQNLQRAAEHLFLVSVYTDPRCRIRSSWNHV